ncbi:hypothetical protein Thiowin_04142 [Thiorhodovibrio winogradskyi]|uniref:NUDIX hydrolase n=1 Tax=Thiorhodovibrio winogradskyi TaxID=77007 RepID=A0ABZ0SEG0_9GAMM|nr:NUDIX hydrolase [Thiorhodovibrio winogradskyi]
MSAWKRLSEIVRLDSQWVSLIGERWRCDKGKELDYWRVEKVDSVIVLPVHNGRLICVSPTFRPGIQRETLDFPGGRLPAGKQPLDIVPFLLERELGVPATAISQITALNQQPWMINSAFSNQGLWGLVADIDADCTIPQQHIGQTAPATAQGVEQLLEALDCLQCRAVLLEWQRLRCCG